MAERKLYRDNEVYLENIKSNISKRKVNYKKIIANVIRYVFIILASIIAFFPFLWMVSSALKVKDGDVVRFV